MAKRHVFRIRLPWVFLGVVIACVVVWWVTHETLPHEIRIATGEEGGLYHTVGLRLKEHLEARTDRRVVLVPTKGSLENGERLRQRSVDLAILQAGAGSTEELTAVAPLYPELVFLVVRRGRGITKVTDLKGRHVSLGREGSGMRKSATTILARYGIKLESLQDTETYFRELLTREELDAAVVTTGMLNGDLRKVMRSGQFQLLPLKAEALAIYYPYFEPTTIPLGLFRLDPPIPEQAVTTVAATAVLAGREDAPAVLVEEALRALYEDYLRMQGPSLISAREAKEWDLLPVHPAVRSYHDPYAGIGLFANLLEGLAGIKELLFGLGAGLYLLWRRRRRIEAQRDLKLLRTQKESLDKLLDETVRIERAQMDCTDSDKLERYLDEVTILKLKALEELSHEALRGDRFFLIFLTQCANLIRKIQSKLVQYRA